MFRTAKVSNIVCRSVRAKVLARPGRLDEALALSDESLRWARVSDFLNAMPTPSIVLWRGTMRSAHHQVAAVAAATLRDRLLIAARRGERMDRPADQLAALVDAASALAASAIPYALIGGIAVGIHSEVPRATQDVDIAVPTGIPRDRVTAVLTTAGFDLLGEFVHSLNFRHPGGERVQVAIDEAFDDMIGRAEPLEVGGVAIAVVSKDDLIAMKERSAGDPSRRPSKALRDRADVELLRGDVPEPDEGW